MISCILVYVAGKYRAKTEAGVHDNIQAARNLAAKVWRPGVAALCPHLNTYFMGGMQPDKVWLDGDLEMIRRCDALITVEGWEASVGATAEVELAKEIAIPVFHDLAAFDAWYAKQT
jgi:hypothetical protein